MFARSLKKFSKLNFIVLDGCKNGWIFANIEKQNLILCYIHHLKELEKLQVNYIFVDMPLKLPLCIQSYPRQADKTAKQILGRFHSSIFYAPLHSWLDLPFKSINSFCQLNHKAKLSKQSFNLFPKIKELQKYILDAKACVLEIHPELIVHSFFGLRKLSKKTPHGQSQRIKLINTLLQSSYTEKDLVQVYEKLRQLHPQARFQKDDCLDACLTACVAQVFFKDKQLTYQQCKCFSHFFDKNVKLSL